MILRPAACALVAATDDDDEGRDEELDDEEEEEEEEEEDEEEEEEDDEDNDVDESSSSVSTASPLLLPEVSSWFFKTTDLIPIVSVLVHHRLLVLCRRLKFSHRLRGLTTQELELRILAARKMLRCGRSIVLQRGHLGVVHAAQHSAHLVAMVWQRVTLEIGMLSRRVELGGVTMARVERGDGEPRHEEEVDLIPQVDILSSDRIAQMVQEEGVDTGADRTIGDSEKHRAHVADMEVHVLLKLNGHFELASVAGSAVGLLESRLIDPDGHSLLRADPRLLSEGLPNHKTSPDGRALRCPPVAELVEQSALEEERFLNGKRRRRSSSRRCFGGRTRSADNRKHRLRRSRTHCPKLVDVDISPSILLARLGVAISERHVDASTLRSEEWFHLVVEHAE